jgi:cytochrome c oxidase subunit 1
MISLVMMIFFLFIIWESLVSCRPAIFRKFLSGAVERRHSFPPMTHSYASSPVVYFKSKL